LAGIPEKGIPLTAIYIKVMPDALSKTIPIWTAVLNRTLFPTETAYHPVHLPPNYLGASEEAQIKSRIDSFVASLKVLIPSNS
jgi:tRNA A64-2'-O-ribosylphosphate transferase